MAYVPPPCQECGCHCESCNNNNSLHLHQEIEDLKERVYAKDLHIVQMETNVLANAVKYPNGEYAALVEEMMMVQDKYERLFENHKRLQKVNQGLEDKLLKIVDKYETEKTALNRDIANLTARLVEARVSLAQLEEENEMYRNDCNIAIQLLQCKPSNFVAHKLETFPIDLQQKAKVHLTNSWRNVNGSNGQSNHAATEARTIRVPIPTFPPTAMVYSVSEGERTVGSRHLKVATVPSGGGGGTAANGSSSTTSDVVSAAIMAKVLEERAKERKENWGCCGKRYARCTCKCQTRRPPDVVMAEAACQTQWSVPPDSNLGSSTGHLDLLQFYLPSATCDGQWSSTPGVHSQRRPDILADYGGRRSYAGSGSSTSTETEI